MDPEELLRRRRLYCVGWPRRRRENHAGQAGRRQGPTAELPGAAVHADGAGGGTGAFFMVTASMSLEPVLALHLTQKVSTVSEGVVTDCAPCPKLPAL